MKDTKIFKVTLVLSFILSLKILFGQDTLSLTEADAIDLGIKSSKLLHSSQMKLENAGAKADEVGSLNKPSLKLSAGYTKLSSVPPGQFQLPGAPNPIVLSPSITNNYSLKASLQENLFTGFKIENSIKAARLNENASAIDLKKDESDFRFAIRLAYWNLFKAKEFKKVVDESVAQVEAHLKDAKNLLAQGVITSNDVLKLEVQLSNTKLTQIDVNNNVQLAQMNLNNLIGKPLNTVIEIASKINLNERVWDNYEAMLDKAMKNRNDIQALELRVKAGEAGLKAAKGAFYPTAAVQANYNYLRPNQRYFPTKDKFNDSWDIGLYVSFDLWNWGATAAQVNQARTLYEQAKDGLGLTKDGASLEVTQSFLAVTQAKEKISVSKQSVEQSEESLRITSEKFKKGVALTTDVTDAEVAVLQAKTNYTNALVDFELAQARLGKSLGNE